MTLMIQVLSTTNTTTTITINDYETGNESVNHRTTIDSNLQNDQHNHHIDNINNTGKVNNSNVQNVNADYHVEYDYADDAPGEDIPNHSYSTYKGEKSVDNDDYGVQNDNTNDEQRLQ